MFLDNISPWNEHNVPSDSPAILFKQPKQLNLVPRFPRSTVQYDSSAAGYGEIMRVLLGNQNRINILNE